MTRQQLPPPGQHTTIGSKRKKRPGFWSRAGKSFVTSNYVTRFWEWFLNLAGRLVQLVLFFTIMYNMAQNYPGFVSPGKWIDQTAFLLQNGALDVGSFGLPKMADQAEKDGNPEGAAKARKIGQALFWLMVSSLVWGGIERVAGDGIPDWGKTSVALLFLVIRAYYAVSYSKVVHALEKAEEPDEDEWEIAPVQVQAESEHLQRLEGQVQTLQREVQALVQGASASQEVQVSEVQGVQTLLAPVQAPEVQPTPVAILPPLPQGQTLLAPVQGASHQGQGTPSRPVQQQGSLKMRPTVVGVQAGAMSSIAPVQAGVQGASRGASVGVQQPTSAKQGQQAIGEEVAPGASREVQQPTGEEVQRHLHDTEPLHQVQPSEVQGATPPGFRETIFAYVLHQVQGGNLEPTVKQIMEGVGCKERTAKSYRGAAIAKAQEAVTHA